MELNEASQSSAGVDVWEVNNRPNGSSNISLIAIFILLIVLILGLIFIIILRSLQVLKLRSKNKAAE